MARRTRRLASVGAALASAAALVVSAVGCGTSSSVPDSRIVGALDLQQTLALRGLGWTGFIQILTFFLILFVGYVYVWRKGVLDWGPAVRKARDLSQRRAA